MPNYLIIRYCIISL